MLGSVLKNDSDSHVSDDTMKDGFRRGSCLPSLATDRLSATSQKRSPKSLSEGHGFDAPHVRINGNQVCCHFVHGGTVVVMRKRKSKANTGSLSPSGSLTITDGSPLGSWQVCDLMSFDIRCTWKNPVCARVAVPPAQPLTADAHVSWSSMHPEPFARTPSVRDHTNKA